MKFTFVEKLEPGMRIGQSIIGISCAEKYVIGTVLTEKDIIFFEEKGLIGVYTMEAQPAEILSPDLMQKCLQAVKKIDINAMLSLAEQIVAELTAKTISLDFRSIRSYDDYLQHHSVCVAVYAVVLGIKLDMGEVHLKALALAGLLHDIGKTLLDQSILIKKEKLTQEEYEQIKKHPVEGYNYILKDDRISTIVKDAVLHHHENINGTGYPDKQNDENISQFARILHVVDVYDAIMSKRPYKKGMSSADAINYLIGGKMILFDEHIVNKFLEIVVPYPTGCEVRLSNGEIVLVVEQSADLSRPIVYIEKKHCMIDLSTNAAYQEVTILNDIKHEGDAKETVSDEAATGESTAITGNYKKKIMIVDDVFVSIAYTKLSLGDDYDIITCLGGSKAASLVRTEKPDLILMDYEMPDMDGVAAVNEIHKLGYHMPIIFLTGKCDKDTVRACSQCGATDYILKPANPVYLRARVDMALHNIDTNAFL